MLTAEMTATSTHEWLDRAVTASYCPFATVDRACPATGSSEIWLVAMFTVML